MKKLLCFLGIICLLFLLLLPPGLRMYLPNKGEKKEIKEASNQILICKNDKYNISTNYDNSEIKMIILKKVLINSDLKVEKNKVDDRKKLERNKMEDRKSLEENKENDQNMIENNAENFIKDLDDLIENLKEKENLTYEEKSNYKMVQIDFSIYDHKNLDLHLVNNKIEEQKSYYEKLGLTCNIID